ncbi:hypothetical protein GCM10011585_36560 [Edaphobacter dinghuensis]|uniref:Uncharacterized protein n=1 Tax=Edaphobacter dinghuensis TaxID=1560005 RepID=A0A917HTU2_9BACT|nr:hypothetical protein GCM10011585_36560 [Edaphobacter dinghuensis]
MEARCPKYYDANKSKQQHLAAAGSDAVDILAGDVIRFYGTSCRLQHAIDKLKPAGLVQLEFLDSIQEPPKIIVQVVCVLAGKRE